MHLNNLQSFLNSLNLFPEFSPNIRKFVIHPILFANTFSKIDTSYMCRWQNLSFVVCPQVTFDMDTLVHLSRMRGLTQLEFTLSTATLPLVASESPLAFLNLHDFTLHSESLEQISRFISQIRLPAITGLGAVMGICPSKRELSSFCSSVQASNTGHTIERLRLDQLPYPQNNIHSEAFSLCLEDLRPFMTFNLRRLTLDIEWNVGLMDSELLVLAFAWPNLEKLYINVERGWSTLDGITPNGLLELLQACRSLSKIGLAIDTRGYTECRELPASLGLTLPPISDIHVPDSMIEVGSMPAVAAFFAGLMSSSMFYFSAWSGGKMIRRQGRAIYKDRWDMVYKRAREAVSLCS